MDGVRFGFRPWVRRTCARALAWGMGVILLLGGAAWMLRGPSSQPASRAFGVLALYGLLFAATLAKIWWTAGTDSVALEGEVLAYRPLHLFRPRRLDLGRVLGCAPKEGTHSLRFVFLGRHDEEREFYLNLAVVDGRHDFVERLGQRLADLGLVPMGRRDDAWRRPGWEPW